ncbi:hypothetical protein ACHQM5_028513 [Ranunculus cassubicifolius]
MATSISSSPALYARIIQVLDSGDMDSRKSLKDELLKIVEKQNSNQNDEIKSQAIQVKDNARDDSSEDTAKLSTFANLTLISCEICRGKTS